MTAPTLSDFLLARIAEDEEVARNAIEDDSGSAEGFSGQRDALSSPPSGIGLAKGGFGEAAAQMISTFAHPARILAECEAKRRIIEDVEGLSGQWYDEIEDRVLTALAQPYSSHPDFRDEWRA